MSRLRIALLTLLAIATGLLAYGAWLDQMARRSGFTNIVDQRDARAFGIEEPAEWRAMVRAGDRAPPPSGGEDCLSETCRRVQARLEGWWHDGGGCKSGARFRFTDRAMHVEQLMAGGPGVHSERHYRIVGATVAVPPGRSLDGKSLAGAVEKRRGDFELWTLTRSNYLRRILRPRDDGTLEVLLVQARVGRGRPIDTLYVEGRSTGGGRDVLYRRC